VHRKMGHSEQAPPCTHVKAILIMLRLERLSMFRAECWPDIPSDCWCNTKPIFVETIAASSNGSKDGILRCNRMVPCQALAEGRWAEGPRVVEALMGILSAPFGSRIFSWQLTNLSPIGVAIHCNPQCNRKGMGKL